MKEQKDRSKNWRWVLIKFSWWSNKKLFWGNPSFWWNITRLSNVSRSEDKLEFAWGFSLFNFKSIGFHQKDLSFFKWHVVWFLLKERNTLNLVCDLRILSREEIRIKFANHFLDYVLIVEVERSFFIILKHKI